MRASFVGSVGRSALSALFLAAATGCGGGAVEVVRAVSPLEARDSGLEAVAIVRATDKVPIPRGARIEKDRVVLLHTERVLATDVIEQDEQSRIVAVRKGSGERVRFVAGTAALSADGMDVRGEQSGGHGVIRLMSHDRIEVRGEFRPDEVVPGGGRVEERRPLGLVVGGATVFVLGYAPAAYVAAASPRPADRVLFVPVAGPFIALASRPACTPPPGSEVIPVDMCIEEKATRGALIAGGAIQSLGALLFAIGIPARTHVVPPAESRRPRRQRTADWTIVPTPQGAAAAGTF